MVSGEKGTIEIARNQILHSFGVGIYYKFWFS